MVDDLAGAALPHVPAPLQRERQRDGDCRVPVPGADAVDYRRRGNHQGDAQQQARGDRPPAHGGQPDRVVYPGQPPASVMRRIHHGSPAGPPMPSTASARNRIQQAPAAQAERL